ncbi:hypothetical protein [Brevibacterium permense]|uniref:hypothetical protein n=1 Tax=Brevibacterium permense TaxID=234834 RepID=UPI0021D2860F|nr:hypothetical protein [Brevibacterium permense]
MGTLFLSVCVFLVLADLSANLPTITWDAVDDRGRPVFGMVVAEPALGAGLWTICGLLGDVRRRRATPAHYENA